MGGNQGKSEVGPRIFTKKALHSNERVFLAVDLDLSSQIISSRSHAHSRNIWTRRHTRIAGYEGQRCYLTRLLCINRYCNHASLGETQIYLLTEAVPTPL